MTSPTPTQPESIDARRRRRLVVAVAVVTLLAAWVSFKWPAYTFVAWRPPPARDVPASPLLDAATRLGEATLPQPEDILADGSGGILAACADGVIRRVDPSGGIATFATTGGRPLGMAWALGSRELLVADAVRGLLRVDGAGAVRVLVDSFEGRKLRLVDDVAVAPDGMIYFSDATARRGVHDDLRLEMASHDPTGQVLAVYPSGRVTRLVGGLYFANGVAISPSGRHLLVNETAAYRIQRCGLHGSERGRCEVWIDRLPGLPDNLRISPRGTVWVALVAPRRAILDDLIHPYVAAKWAMAMAPGWLLPKAELRGQVLEVDQPDAPHGTALRLLQAPAGAYAMSTSAREVDGVLWLGHIDARQGGVLRVNLPERPTGSR